MEDKCIFTAVIEREGRGYISFCPEFDIACQGDSLAEARASLAEAVERFLETASLAEIRARYHCEVQITGMEISCARAAQVLGHHADRVPVEAKLF
jgi:predicted RNase H-like HicB family nuclease